MEMMNETKVGIGESTEYWLDQNWENGRNSRKSPRIPTLPATIDSCGYENSNSELRYGQTSDQILSHIYFIYNEE